MDNGGHDRSISTIMHNSRQQGKILILSERRVIISHDADAVLHANKGQSIPRIIVCHHEPEVQIKLTPTPRYFGSFKKRPRPPDSNSRNHCEMFETPF
ncbi:hypothetical protein CDAR_170451 [Caerostris darwini]|uniref:Uncharacterized protein n=1 Tax=Caerostris darwini TaxID=1538125 RepID=A0AAV4R8L6_9ARAC|nr:hypothetical protein CDAR_170451 [Caerostris darwini]